MGVTGKLQSVASLSSGNVHFHQGEIVVNLFKRILSQPPVSGNQSWFRKSYSQMGEDMMLDIILYGVEKGFYVDIGANDPWKQSNTCFFYEHGWSGINIDALPGSMAEFNVARTRDINLEIAISENEEVLTYYSFENPVYNTLDGEKAKAVEEKLIDTLELRTRTLAWVLDQYCPVKEIEFFTVDTEGFELQVLRSNNWEKYRPKVIVVEMDESRTQFEKTELVHYLEELHYTFYCNTTQNAFFFENGFLSKRFPSGSV
jgi:FkbM family methyltransferase